MLWPFWGRFSRTLVGLIASNSLYLARSYRTDISWYTPRLSKMDRLRSKESPSRSRTLDRWLTKDFQWHSFNASVRMRVRTARRDVLIQEISLKISANTNWDVDTRKEYYSLPDNEWTSVRITIYVRVSIHLISNKIRIVAWICSI